MIKKSTSIEQLATKIYYAQSKGVDISVDDWIKKLDDLLKTQKEKLQDKYAHPTEEGYCCACDYDIAGFESKLETERKRRKREKIETSKAGSKMGDFRIKAEKKGIKDDLTSVINMLKGTTERNQIINYIKEYLVEYPIKKQ